MHMIRCYVASFLVCILYDFFSVSSKVCISYQNGLLRTPHIRKGTWKSSHEGELEKIKIKGVPKFEGGPKDILPSWT